MQQKQTCKCAWKQGINTQRSQFSLINQTRPQLLRHQKQNHQLKVHVAATPIAAVVQEVLRPRHAIVTAKPVLQKKLKTKTKVDGFVCSHQSVWDTLQRQQPILLQKPGAGKPLMNIGQAIGIRPFLQEWVLNLEETNNAS